MIETAPVSKMDTFEVTAIRVIAWFPLLVCDRIPTAIMGWFR